jgi:hypothetical protein
MRALATVTPVVGQSVVTREAYVPNIEVSAFAGDIPLSMTLNVVKARMAKLELPRGYTLEVAGESNDLAEARGSLLWALGIAVVAVYLLLVAQLKSWLHPVTIMMSVPLSLIGVGLALKLGGKPISMPAGRFPHFSHHLMENHDTRLFRDTPGNRHILDTKASELFMFPCNQRSTGLRMLEGRIKLSGTQIQ